MLKIVSDGLFCIYAHRSVLKVLLNFSSSAPNFFSKLNSNMTCQSYFLNFFKACLPNVLEIYQFMKECKKSRLVPKENVWRVTILFGRSASRQRVKVRSEPINTVVIDVIKTSATGAFLFRRVRRLILSLAWCQIRAPEVYHRPHRYICVPSAAQPLLRKPNLPRHSCMHRHFLVESFSRINLLRR